jgi:hypothetical protein
LSRCRKEVSKKDTKLAKSWVKVALEKSDSAENAQQKIKGLSSSFARI